MKYKGTLSQKVKYNGEHHNSGEKLVIDEKDLDFFEDRGLFEEEPRKIQEPDNKDNEKSTNEPLEDKTVKQLMKIARELEIEGRSKLKNDKEKLISVIKKESEKEEGDTETEKDGE